MAGRRKALRSCDYTPPMLAFLKEGYKGMDAKTLTEAFNDYFGTDKTPEQIKGTVSRHGFKAGRSGCFPQGQQPWNKGKHGVNGYSSTRFKRGQQPPTAKPIGYQRISKDGLIEIKVQEQYPQFKGKHVIEWEKVNGSVPEGCVIRFKDGDNRNFDPDNLVCVTRREHAWLNKKGFSYVPKELRGPALAVAKLEVKIHEVSA